MMSPLQIAKAECANFHGDDGCLGFPVECMTSDQPTMAAPLDRCKLAKAGERCAYFECVVIPLAKSHPEKYAKAVETYTASRTRNALLVGPARLCECGNPLPKHRRFCEKCRTRKRRESTRAAVRKCRGLV